MNKHPTIIITGAQGEGKTTALKKVLEKLKASNIPFAGFVAEGEWENGLRTQFYIRDANSNVNMILCQADENKSFQKQGRFYFNPEAIQFGEKLVNNRPNNSIVVIDEIGLFELKGYVWASLIKELIANRETQIIITVRDTFIDQVISSFKIINSEVIHCKTSVHQIVTYIQKAID